MHFLLNLFLKIYGLPLYIFMGLNKDSSLIFNTKLKRIHTNRVPLLSFIPSRKLVYDKLRPR